jgi:hypothetical protein
LYRKNVTGTHCWRVKVCHFVDCNLTRPPLTHLLRRQRETSCRARSRALERQQRRD